MNIALGVLLLLLFLAPGVALRISYLNGPNSRRNIDSNFSDELVISIIPSFIFQIAGYFSVENIFNYDIQLNLLYQIIIGSTDIFKNPGYLFIFKNSVHLFLIYNLVLISCSVVLGQLGRKVVYKLKLDEKNHWLRFNNDWHYLLSSQFNKCDFVYIDLIMDINNCSYIYCGVLLDFFSHSKNVLDRIYIYNVYRRELKNDPNPKEKFEDRYYQIPGDIFVIKYSDVRNMNISYLKFQERKTDSQKTDPQEVSIS